MIIYIYPDRETKTKRERQQAPIMHTNVSTYAQTLMNFHKTNPVPNTLSNKRLKIRLNDEKLSSKRNSTLEETTPTLSPHDKTITFIESDSPIPAETVAATDNVNHETKRNPGRPVTTRGRSTIGGRGDTERGGTYGRGGTNGRGYTQYQPTSPSGDWRDTLRNIMSDLQTNIMKEVQLSISAQIKEPVMVLTSQVTNAIKEGLSLRLTNILD